LRFRLVALLTITPLGDAPTTSELLGIGEHTVTVGVKASQEAGIDAAAIGLHARLGLGRRLGVLFFLCVLNIGSLCAAGVSVLGHRGCGEGET
jgi:hypothetical protein